MAKFHNNEATLSYAEHLMSITEQQTRHMERRKTKNLNVMEAEEILIQKKKIEAMDNEDWDASDIEINEEDL